MDTTLEKINKVGVKLLRPLTPEETYEIIIDEAVKLVGADFGSIFLFESGKLERVYTSFPSLYEVKIRPSGFTYAVFKKRQPIIVDLKQFSRIHPMLKNFGVKSDMIVALSYRNKSIGVISLLSQKKDYFSKKHLDILKLFASIASLAIRKLQLYQQTQKALESRDLFISLAAHELRTPLATINGYAQLLRSNKSKLDLQHAKWVEELSWETYRLIQLINELLELNRVKTGKLQYLWKECSLREVIKRAIKDFNFSHSEYKLLFKDKLADGEEVVVGDFDKLLQVVINLLDNAAKFSPNKKDIIISLKFRSPYLVVIIQDHGVGISKKDLPNIFNEFYKGRSGEGSGMGLGLFLCKNIIEQHKGSIKIQSQVNKGTKVEIKLPKAQI